MQRLHQSRTPLNFPRHTLTGVLPVSLQMKYMQAVNDARKKHAHLVSSSTLIARAQGLIRSGMGSVRKLEQDPQVKGVFGHVPQLVHNKGMQVCTADWVVYAAAGWELRTAAGRDVSAAGEWVVAQAKDSSVIRFLFLHTSVRCCTGS